MSQPRIFVSYSRKDADFTQHLVTGLHQAGAEVWVDVEGITTGNFMRAIDEAMAKCDWMVLVLTPNALASEYVVEETYTALHRVKQGLMRAVIPILAVACAPGSIPPQWDVLQRYDATRDYPAALTGVLHAVGLPSDSADGLVASADALVAQKQFAEALPLLERVTRLASNNFSAWATLGHVHHQLQRELSTATADDLLAWDKTDRAYHELEDVQRLAHQQASLIAYERALTIKPNDAEAWYQKGIVLCDLQRYDDALVAVERALALDPTYALAWDLKAGVEFHFRRWGQALAAYDRALALDPKDAHAWRNKSFVFHNLGRHAEAQKAERRARELGG